MGSRLGASVPEPMAPVGVWLQFPHHGSCRASAADLPGEEWAPSPWNNLPLTQQSGRAPGRAAPCLLSPEGPLGLLLPRLRWLLRLLPSVLLLDLDSPVLRLLTPTALAAESPVQRRPRPGYRDPRGPA